ncbi:MAG: protein-arginine deiminase family protein [Planctomycetota bacterium]
MGMAHAKPTPRLFCLAAVIAAVGGRHAGVVQAADEVVVLANRDDDDHDGLPDADDDRVNGAADARDLGTLVIPLPAGTTRVRLSAGDLPLRFYRPEGGSWRHLGRGTAEVDVAAGVADDLVVHVEGLQWTGMPPGAAGAGVVRVERIAGSGAAEPLEIPVRIAPVRLLPSTAPVKEAYIATGRYDNAAFLEAFRGLLEPLGVPLREHATRDWREMWMQDTMEVGVAAAEGSAMSVVLAGLRGADTFPPTLLGPDVAVAEVAGPRTLAGGDAWADWYGNLEVSPPTAAHPAGRVIHGRNPLTGCTFHPDVVAFLTAQRTQPPVWIDTSWLLIKHVDEIVAFLPGRDGQTVILVPDPEEGLRLAAEAHAAEPVTEHLREANQRIARRIAGMLSGAGNAGLAGSSSGDEAAAAGGLLALLGLDESRVVRLPVVFEVPAEGLLADGGVTNAASLWSNPVNALFVNGVVICGAAGMPEAVRETCRERFLAAGADRVEFIDDGVYQKNHGNVHCATNARRRDQSVPNVTDPEGGGSSPRRRP